VKLCFVLHADKSFRWLAVREQDERRNTLDTVLGGELLVCVDIDFRHDRTSLGRDRFNDWFKHLTRPTPISVKIG
jgi:hypothetical protein